jgi:hypothetical protein
MMTSAQKNLAESPSISLYSFDPVFKQQRPTFSADVFVENCFDDIFQCDIFPPNQTSRQVDCMTLFVNMTSINDKPDHSFSLSIPLHGINPFSFTKHIYLLL